MTTMTATPPRETWKDWIGADTPEPELITRDLLLEELHEEGVDISERKLMYWESEGVLPRPVRRWQDGAPRALYPVWMIAVLREFRQIQDRGDSLDQIRARVRSNISNRRYIPDPFLEPQRKARDAITEYVRTHERFTGQRVSGVEVQLLDEDGRLIDYFGFPVIPQANQ